MTESQAKEKTSKPRRPWWKRGLKVLGWSLLSVFILLFAVILFVRSPWGQDVIVGKATQFVSNKTQTKVSIEKLFITFTGDIVIDGLFLEDKQKDTLLYSQELLVEIPIWPILTGNPIAIDGLEWRGLRANVTRKDTISGFNYQFLIDAFSSDSAASAVEPEAETSEPLKISVGSVHFSDFKVKYEDGVDGIFADLNLGNFFLEGKNLDLEKMKFQVAEMSLENTKVNFVQSKASPPSEPDTSESVLPFLSLDDLDIKNVWLNYKSVPDGIDAQFDLAELALQVPKADLENQEIEVGQFALNNSNIKLKIAAPDTTEAPTVETMDVSEESIAFIWPEWNVKVASIALANNYLDYQAGEVVKDSIGFNPNYIVLNNFSFKAKDIALFKEESAHINLEDISFQEISGLVLNKLTFEASIKPTKLSLDKFVLETGNSSINTDIYVGFSSIQQFIDRPENSPIELNLESFKIDLNDAFKFQPNLSNNEYVSALAKHNLTGQIKAKGKLSQVALPTFLVNWGENTKVETQGEFQNLLDIDNLIANIDNFTFSSTRTDLSNFVSEEELGISIPKTVSLQSQFNGKLDDFKAKVLLAIPEGKVKVDGKFKQQDKIAFDAKVDVINFKLGEILKNPNLGQVAFKLQASGDGNNINDLDAVLASSFSKFELNGYDYSALKFNGKLKNGEGDVNLNYLDRNLDLALDSKIQLDSIAPKIALDLRLEGADFYALGLTQKEIKAKLMMQAKFKGNADSFELESHFTEGLAIYDGDNHYLGSVDIVSGVTKDSVALDVKSDFLSIMLRANAGIDPIMVAVKNQLESYYTDTIAAWDTMEKPVKIQMSMRVAESDLLTDFLVPEIKEMDTFVFNVDFDQMENRLKVNLDLPYLDYAGNTIDSLKVNLKSAVNDATFKLGFNALEAGPIAMNKTYFDGNFQKGLLDFHIHALVGEKEMYVIKTELSGNKSDFKFHVDPEKLIINGVDWAINKANEITLNNGKLAANKFRLRYNNQSVSIENDLIETTQENIGIDFENFQLANILALFNNDELLATGDLQGDIVAVNPLDNLGVLADFKINNLNALETTLGKLSLKAKTENNKIFKVDLGLKGSDVDLDLVGDYSIENVGSELDFILDLKKIGMRTIASISGEALKDATGNISGEFKVLGSPTTPDYKGFIQFNDANFNVTEVNSKFRLTNDKISIDTSAISFKKFSIEDEKKNTFTLDGEILTADLMDPAFDLKINSKNFQAVNSTVKDNEEFYGSFNFNMNGTILGKLSAPIVDMNIAVNDKTDFTYVLQNSQASIEKSEGIVEFVNKKDPDNILTRTKDSSNIALFGGIELHVRLKISKEAQFNVIIDPKTGDQLNIAGAGDLKFNIAKNGLTTLNGRYDISKGSYSLTLYNLVKRRFELEPGSSIVWQGGDPLDAELNVTAKYTVETSASTLMASQTSGSSEETKNKYKQKLPFQVYLIVNGELDLPILDFNLGMPEESRGAIDGTVYSRIKQLNTQDDELNKQVFSLLVLERFYPNAGSDGSSGGTANLVRTNINDAVADQLTAFSGKLTGNTGIELDFGLNSYTDYQGETEQQRTDLNISAQKKLFDNRLIIQVGSDVSVEGSSNPGEENPVIGNVSIQYVLTKDGYWRLKGFRNSEYENIIDGQIFINGISLLFQREFNKFSELFNSKKESEEDSGFE